MGFDKREDRRKEAEEKHQIKTFANFDHMDFGDIEVMIISTPPDYHNIYIEKAIDLGIPCFVEVNVILGNLIELNDLARKKNVLVAPSCTARFHPGIKDIKRIVDTGIYGKITNFSYHCGQYLPDWHPWESVMDYYVVQKQTGGCRELVSFEMAWLVDAIGFPERVRAFHGKTMNVGADIDDTYSMTVELAGGAKGCIMIDVVARYALRNLILNMEFGQILWRWDENIVKLYEAGSQRWIHHYYAQGQAAEGYNKNIIEDMYVEELKTFIDSALGKAIWPHALEEDIKILRLLEKIEASDEFAGSALI